LDFMVEFQLKLNTINESNTDITCLRILKNRINTHRLILKC